MYRNRFGNLQLLFGGINHSGVLVYCSNEIGSALRSKGLFKSTFGRRCERMKERYSRVSLSGLNCSRVFFKLWVFKFKDTESKCWTLQLPAATGKCQRKLWKNTFSNNTGRTDKTTLWLEPKDYIVLHTVFCENLVVSATFTGSQAHDFSELKSFFKCCC